jgi:uncharacterized membrane protein YkoI
MKLRHCFFVFLLMGAVALQPALAFAGDGDRKSGGGDRYGDNDREDSDDGEDHHYDNDDDNEDSDSNSLSSDSNTGSNSNNTVADSGNVGSSNSTGENRRINEIKSSDGASLKEVFDIVKKSYDGEIVHVSLWGSGSNLTYGIRLLDESSNIVDLQVNAMSLAIALSPIPY